MNTQLDKHILVIDQHEFWRNLAVRALRSEGYSAYELGTYDPSKFDSAVWKNTPDLVVFGCAKVGVEEQTAIIHTIESNYPVLVLCLTLSAATMRTLFKLGVTDITEKPFEIHEITKTIQQTLDLVQFHRNELLHTIELT